MSETSPTPRHVLHLIMKGFPSEKLAELSAPSPGTSDIVEILPLNEANAREALEKIFAADAVAVWSQTE
jgi:hypothetical protein